MPWLHSTSRALRGPPTVRPWAGHLFAVGVTLVAFALQHVLVTSIALVPFLLSFLAVFISAWIGGRGPGITSMVLSGVLANYHFVPPVDAFSASPRALVLMGLYVLVSGVVVLLCSSLRDAMQRAERSAALLRAVQNQMPAGVIVADASGELVAGNEEMQRIFRQPVRPSERTAHFAERKGFHPDGRPYAPDEWPLARSLLRGEAVVREEIEILRGDGTRGFVSASSAPVRDSQGRLVAAVVVDLDVTERKRAESEVRRTAERFQRLVEASAQILWVANGRGEMEGDSPSWRAFTGHTFEQWVGERWLCAVHPEDRERVARAWKNAVSFVAPFDIEFRLIHVSGEYRHVVCHAVPVFDDGHVLEWIGMNTDITVRKRAEEALREAARQKDEFLAVLSHELRNPLSPLHNSLFILERAPPGGEQAARAREVMARQVSHLTRLVDDLLDVTRIARGKVRLQRERMDLVDVVRRTADDQRPAFAKARVALAVDLPDAPLWMYADETRIAQAVGNLLHNAAKFTPPDGRVALALSHESGEGILRVRDTGVGVGKELLGRIFEPFAQDDRTLDRSRGGLGLGLALVKGLVEQHGGTVTVTSEGTGTGTEFVVRLPVDAAPQRSDPARLAAGKPAARKILVVEDNVDTAQSLADVLRLRGHEVAVAYDGHEGVERVRELRPDVVLCDVGLPGMDGYEVARAVRADAGVGRVFLVALTGYARPEDVARAKAAGFDRHLAKPAALDTLERILADAAAA